MKLLPCLLISLISITAFAKPHKPTADTPDVYVILDRSETVYHNLHTYLDSGKVVTTITRASRVSKTAKLFKTAFTADGSFNFEYYELGRSNSLYTINRTAGVVKTWWGINDKIETPTLSRGLMNMLGVSSTTSRIVPAMLLTSDFDSQTTFYHTMGDAKLIGSETVSGQDCYIIKAFSIHTNQTTTIWIAKGDLLIRKIETDMSVKAAAIIASQQKIDSINSIRTAKDTAFRRQDSINRAIVARSNFNNKPADFTVTDTFMYYPYTLKTPNPELFKFRPNRQIEL